jgi:dihydropteroate synthase
MSERAAPTIALTGILRGRGADILRVHDVKENVAALLAAEAVVP